jgi:hypothetical protein
MVDKGTPGESQEQDREQTPPEIETQYKKVVTIMSWVLGTSFFLVIFLPNFIPPSLDILVKILFFLGLITLLGFAVLEMFGKKIKLYFRKQQ